MKRSHVAAKDEDDDDDDQASSSSSSTGAQDAERMDVDDDDDDDDDDDEVRPQEEQEPVASDADEPEEEEGDGELGFMDTFYGLSSPHAAERAHAAEVLLRHCFSTTTTTTTSNIADTAYAWKRLLLGLRSGRACARQGNASALTTFLKLCIDNNHTTLTRIQEYERQQKNNEERKDEESSSSSVQPAVHYVRHCLRQATTSSDSGGKGSEERDCQFGRLFGILAVVKSGMLCPAADSSSSSSSGNTSNHLADLVTVHAAYVEDLIELYEHKKWMRESAAHAICMLLNSLYAQGPANMQALEIVQHVVTHVLAPKLFFASDLASYSAEQIAIAVHLQTHTECHPAGFPVPLNKAVFTVGTIPVMAKALSETSVVTQPRTHLVWDVIWEYLTVRATQSGSRNVTVLTIRASTPVANESIEDVLHTMMHSIVIARLLGINEKTTDESSKGKTTHERRALALCIVRNLLGVEFVSSIAGRTKLRMGPHIAETTILDPILVRRLFMDTIGAGKGGGSLKNKQQADHMLKPLATHILESIVASIVLDESATEEESSTSDMRLAVLRALLGCDPRFDAKLKLTTVQSLLYSNAEALEESFWNELLSFIQGQILKGEPDKGAEGSLNLPPYEAVGYVDLLFHLAKESLTTERNVQENAAEDRALKKTKSNLAQQVLDFLMVCAFFDCQNVKDLSDISTIEQDWSSSSKKKKKKKRKSKGNDEKHAVSPIVKVATAWKSSRSGSSSCLLAYEVRTVASSRFFSLLSELVAATLHSTTEDKESGVLSVLNNVRRSCQTLEDAGAQRLQSDEIESMATDEKRPEEVVDALCEHAISLSNAGNSNEVSKKRLFVGLAILSLVVFLHLLSCGQPESTFEDDVDADDDEDNEVIKSLLADMFELFEALRKPEKDDEPMDDEKLLAAAELCTNVLSSPLSGGSQSRGSAPKLLREAVKIAWTRALSLASAVDDPKLHPKVIPVLLEGVGIASAEADEEHSGDDENDEDDMSSEGRDDNEAISPNKNEKASGEGSSSGSDENHGSDNDEIELDPAKLQSLLEEDMDEASVEENELEHHEGADGALAKLIQLKQDARKAGQKAKERLELTRQLRCTLLLETLVSGKPEGWGSLLRVDTLLEIAATLLQYRNELEKSISKAKAKGLDSSLGEKKAMLDRVSGILKAKLLKAKVSSMAWTERIDTKEFGDKIAAMLLKEARRSDSKEHRHLCSNTILFLIRGSRATEDKLRIAGVYAEAVDEWATKRTTRFDGSFFDQLIQQAPTVAQIALPEALAKAAFTARSSFLKSEAFRLLSQMYSHKFNPNGSELDELGVSRIREAADTALRAISLALKDDEMKKTKRVREILKTTEKLASFLLNNDADASLNAQLLREVKTLVGTVHDGTDSKGIGHACEKLEEQFEALASRQEKKDVEAEGLDPAAEDVVELGETKSSSKSKKKKSKSSKKKTKRR